MHELDYVAITFEGDGLRQVLQDVKTTSIEKDVYCVWKKDEKTCFKFPLAKIRYIVEKIK